MRTKFLIGIILFVITQFSYSQNTKTEEVITIEEYGSSLDEFDYARYVENRDISYLKRELGNTGVFHRIQNLGNRKYFCVYTVYILPNSPNEVTRDLSKLSVKSFEEWKEYEIQNEIKRRERKSSLKNTLNKLHSKLSQLYTKYTDKIISNNRELMLGYVFAYIESGILNIERDKVEEWEVWKYKVLPNDDFIKFIDNPQHIEPKSNNDTVGYELQVELIKGEETLMNLPFIIYNINDDWSNLNLQIGSAAFGIDILKYDDRWYKNFSDKVQQIKNVKDVYELIEVSYDDYSNYALMNHIKKLQKSFDKLSSEFNELVSSEFNYFDYGSSFYRMIRPDKRGNGLFDIDEVKQVGDSLSSYLLYSNNLTGLEFNPTEYGKLSLYRLKFINYLGVQLDDLKTRLKNELKFHIKDEKLLDNVVDKCSNYMIKNYLTFKLEENGTIFIKDVVYDIEKQPSDDNIKFFELIEIIKSTKSKLTFRVENSYKYASERDINNPLWVIDFKNMKLEHYTFFVNYRGKWKTDELLTSIDLN